MQTTQTQTQHETRDTAPLDPPDRHGPPSPTRDTAPTSTASDEQGPTIEDSTQAWTPPPWTPGQQALWITTGVIAATELAVLATALARGATF